MICRINLILYELLLLLYRVKYSTVKILIPLKLRTSRSDEISAVLVYQKVFELHLASSTSYTFVFQDLLVFL